MELDQFRDVDLVIDYANYSFIEKQFVSQGDYKGRTLTVQVTNNGVVGEVPGLMLSLNWHNEANGLTDLSAFSVLDKANSIYRIEYPQHMMTPGRVVASIQVIQDGKVTNLKQFELTVQKLAGEPVGIVDRAEFSALVAVLADANEFRTDIDVLNNNKADRNDLNATNQNVLKLETNKVDKGGNEQVTLEMLAQDVKESMTGGSVAVVGPKGVNTSNIANRAVTPYKTDHVKVGKNLFDPSKVQVGVYYDSLTGEKISNQSYSTIELDVNAGQYLMFQTGETLRPFRHIASYDASDNFIAEKSFNNRGSSTAPWQIPAGVATIRASFVAGYLDILPYAFYGQSQSEYVPFGFTLREDISLSDKKISEIGESEFNGEKLIADKSIPLAKLSSVETGKNIFDKENYNSGYVEKNGTIVANALLYYTAKIPISLNQSVSVLGRGNKSVHMRKICAYDKDGNALSAYGFDKTPDVEFKSTYTNTTPDVTHIVVSFSNNMANLGACLPEDLMISYGTVPTNFEEYMLVFAGVGLSEKQIAQVGVSNNLKGKVIKNAGDSIAAGDGNANKGYAEIFAEMFGCNCIDYAKGGATITKALNPTNNICSQIDTIMSDGGSEPDFLLVNGRTNDMNSTYVDTFALGTITSGYDTTNLNYDLSTFTGSLEYIFAKVRQSWGSVKILFVSVHKMGSRDLVKQETLHNRTLEVCKKWSIDVVNVYDEGELNTNLPSMYKYSNPTEANPLGDKTHPNQAGYEYAYIPLLKNVIDKHLI